LCLDPIPDTAPQRPQLAPALGPFLLGQEKNRQLVKPANQREYRRDRRLSWNQNGKRKVVVVIRERGGNSVPAVFNTEGQAASFIRTRIAKGTVVYADEAACWDHLDERFEIKRINHQEAYRLNGACTDMAEE
jgi:hypothetical protein